MAGQLARVRRDSRLRVDQNAQLQARMRFLPQIMANKAAKKIETKRDAQFERTIGLEEQKFALQKKRNKIADRQSEVGMGLEAAKFGTNLAFSPMGTQNLGQTLGVKSGIFGGGNTELAKGAPGAKPGMLGSLRLGSAVSSGLTGFGLGKIIGGSKKKRLLAGAVGGSLMGLLAGGKSSSLGQSGLKAGIGGLLGGLGGLF